MKLVIFTYERDLDINHEIMYVDRNLLGEKSGSEIVEEIKNFNPDLIIEREFNDGRAIYTNEYKHLQGIPKAWWCIDAHCNLIDHITYAKQFDYVFCAQSWFVPMFEKETQAKVFYLPLCHTQTMTQLQEMLTVPVEKDLPLSFIGNIRSFHVERYKHVQTLLKMFGDNFFARQSSYESTLLYLRRSNMVFNCSLNNDLNFRVFEALACGAGVMTDYVTDVDSIAGLKRYITTYDKFNPNFSKLQQTVFIGDNIDFIKGGHTLTHRYLQILEMFQKGEQHKYV